MIHTMGKENSIKL